MKKIQKIITWLLVFAMILTLLPVNTAEAAKKVTVKSVTVSSSLSGNKKTVVVAKGKKVKLSTVVKVTPNKSTYKKVTYSSSNKKIATVDNKGYVKGVKAGSAKITVKSTQNKKKKAIITVKVMKGAVTKVSLNKTKGSLNVGNKVSLKATVKAKAGADKTIAWTTSNKKVATVSSKGVVKAVGTGSATITAKAIDGSGKKATYKVKVTDPRNLTKMSIINNRSITFSLDKPLALQAKDIVVKKKSYHNGTYRNTLGIDNISTKDNVNYSVVLSTQSVIYANEFVQLSIPGLTGSVKSKEAIYSEKAAAYTEDSVVTLKKGNYYTNSFSFSSGNGYSSYTITNLPAGLTATSKNSEIIVKGVPTTAGVKVATLKAVDELGNTLTQSITFAVYADDTVVAAATESYYIFTGEAIVNSTSIICNGGSGAYTYTVTSDPNGLVTNKNSQGVLSSRKVEWKAAAAGNYAVKVRVQDKNKPTLYCDVVVKIHIQQGITIGGCVLDSSGNKIPNVYVTLTNKDKGSKCTYSSVFTNYQGVYGVSVLPGTYDITVSYNSGYYGNYSEAAQATKYLYNQTLNASKTGFDIQLPLYKVTIADMKDENGYSVSYDDWYYNHERVGSGSSFYLKAGNYKLETDETYDTLSSNTTGDWFKGKTTTTTRNYYKYVTNVNIVNSSVQVAANKTSTTKTETISTLGAKDSTYQMYQGYTYCLDSDSAPYYAYYFIPNTTGTYTITNSYSNKDQAYFYNANGQRLGNTNVSLTAGTKYYVATGTGKSTNQYISINSDSEE